jgi:hypothetical protein
MESETMIESSIHEDDPWASLAEELGVDEKKVAPIAETATKSHPKLPEAPIPSHAPVESAPIEEKGPELLDAPELLEDEGEQEDDSLIEGSSTEVNPEGAGRKRKRKRRRGKKKPEGEPTAAVTSPTVLVAAPLEEVEVIEEVFSEETPESTDEEESVSLGAALDEEMESETIQEKTTWNVTSWKDLIAGLYRPER